MSRGGGRGGRGGRGGGSFVMQTFRSLTRETSLSQWSDDSEPYPQLQRRPPQPAMTKKSLQYMLAVKRDFESRFQASEWRGDSTARLPVSWRQLPKELRRRRLGPAAPAKQGEDEEEAGAAAPAAADADAAAEEAEKQRQQQQQAAQAGDEDDASDDDADEHFDNDEELEDNDYVDTYFDNGEAYGPEEEGEDMEGESWYY